MKPIFLTVGAGEFEKIGRAGTFIFLRGATDSIRVVVHPVQDRSQSPVEMTLNKSQKLEPGYRFAEVEFHNDTGTDVDLEILIGFGKFESYIPDVVNVEVDDSTPIDVSVVQSDPSAAPSSSVNSHADLTPGQGNANLVTFAANLNRVRAIVTAHPSNADVLRVGDAGVDVANGTPLSPGESMPWDCTDACNVCSEGATAGQKVSFTEFDL